MSSFNHAHVDLELNPIPRVIHRPSITNRIKSPISGPMMLNGGKSLLSNKKEEEIVLRRIHDEARTETLPQNNSTEHAKQSVQNYDADTMRQLEYCQ